MYVHSPLLFAVASSFWEQHFYPFHAGSPRSCSPGCKRVLQWILFFYHGPLLAPPNKVCDFLSCNLAQCYTLKINWPHCKQWCLYIDFFDLKEIVWILDMITKTRKGMHVIMKDYTNCNLIATMSLVCNQQQIALWWHLYSQLCRIFTSVNASEIIQPHLITWVNLIRSFPPFL